MEQKRLKRQNSIANTLNYGRQRGEETLVVRFAAFREADLEDFLNMSFEEFKKLSTSDETALLGRAARSVERRRCGFKRRLRKCNEGVKNLT